MIGEITSYVKKKIKDFEIYYTENEELNTEMNNNKINFISEGHTQSVGVRVVIDGKLGFAFTSDVRNFKQCVDNAIKIARMNKRDPYFKRFAIPKTYEDFKILDKKTKAIDADYIHKFNEEFLSELHSMDANIVEAAASFSRDISQMHVVNSEGIDFKETNAYNDFCFSLSLKHKGRLESLEIERGGRQPLVAEGLGKEGAERLLSLLNRKQTKTVTAQLLLHPEAFAALLAESYAFSISSENVQQKKSILEGKMGQQVFDEKISITDDAVTNGLLCTRSCDDEGVPSQKTQTINKGMLKSFLYNEYTAAKENRESTGNAYRSAQTQPSIGTNNVIMQSGDSSNPLEEIKKGLYVKGLLGVHTMNTATGDFSLSVLEGHYVENGEIKYPVKDTMVSGNFFELMKDVEALSKEIQTTLKKAMFAGVGGYYIPEILFPKVKVIGKS